MPEAPRPMSDDDLGRALTQLGSELDYPAPADLRGRVLARLRADAERPRTWRDLPGLRGLARGRARVRGAGRPAWQPLVAAAAIVLVVFGASLVAFPAVREAVADWLGLRGIGISVVPSLAPVPTTQRQLLFLGTPISLEDAQATVSWRILLPADPLLGPPDEVYLDRSRTADGIVSLVWSARPGLPAASTTGAGLLLTEFRGSIDQRFFQKMIGPGTTIEPVQVDGQSGYWLSGAPHELLAVDRDGNPIADTVRLAGNVLMWEDGEVTLRIESALSEAAAIGVGASVR